MKCTNYTNKAFAIVLVAAMMVGAVCILADDASADSSFTVTDGKGVSYTFDSVPEHIVTIGKGVTATAIELGVLDKVVVCDSYSKTATESVYAPLKEKINANQIKANGNIYSSGKANLITDIVDSADTEKQGVFDKQKDVIFITGSDTYVTSIKATLTSSEYGFKYVLWWNDITDYADIANFVETVSKVTKGNVDPQVEKMKNLSEVISTKLSGKEKRDAFYVTYSSNVFKVGNTGSLANSMIIAAGGNSVTVDSSKSGSTYEANITDIVTAHPNAIIFIDNTIKSSTENYNSLVTQLGGKTTNIVPLQSLWNNYCVESMDGVWTMACAMYPDTFSGDIPTPENGGSDNTMIYIGAGIGVVVVALAAAFIFMRKH